MAKRQAQPAAKSKGAARKRGRGQTIEAPEAVPAFADRPIRLDEIVGHDRALAVLRSSLESGRVHHAWVFHGPPGVGKFTTALAFAAALLDPAGERWADDLGDDHGGNDDGGDPLFGGVSSEPAGEDLTERRRLLRQGAHPDLHVVRKELAMFHADRKVRERKLTNIPVDVVRDHVLVPAGVRASAGLRGAAATKVFIIDEAELLQSESQNAMLKTLEEPGEGTVIMLVTSREDRLLPTIRSRSQRVAFTPLSGEELRHWAARAEARGALTGDFTDEWVLGFADGSPGRLETAVQTGLSDWGRTLAPMLADARGGVFAPALGVTMKKLVDGWASAYVKAGADDGENRSKEAANRLAARWMFSVVGYFARRAMAHEESAAWGAHAVAAIGVAESLVWSNVSLAFVFEDLAVRLSEPVSAVV